MLIKEFYPNDKVSEFIRCFRVVHIIPRKGISLFSKFYIPKPETVLHTIVKGLQNIRLTAVPTEKFSYDSFLSGQQTQPFVFENQGELLNVQIVFKPTAFFKITGIPSPEVANNFWDANLIFGNKISHYRERLYLASSYNEMIEAAEQFVLNLLKNAKGKESRIDQMFATDINSRNNYLILHLAKETCLCSKQFGRVFFETVGVNPKMYLRISRFSKAYNIKNAQPDWDWLKIALECDYYDYQHLRKEYEFFTGTTPVKYHQVIECTSPEVQLGVAREIYQQRFNQLIAK